jgi:hypothetical protein
VPPKVARVDRRGEPYDERTHIGAAPPASPPDQLVERVIECWSVGGLAKRERLHSVLVVDSADADDWTSPGCGVIRIAADRLPNRRSGLVRDPRGNAPSMRAKPSSMNRRTCAPRSISITSGLGLEHRRLQLHGEHPGV